MNEEQQGYLVMERSWAPRICPICEQETAIGHGWVFRDPPPSPPLEDKRRAVREVFFHAGSRECGRGSA
jgi:hypothetical protein